MATVEDELQSQVRIKLGPQPEAVGSKLNHQFQAGAVKAAAAGDGTVPRDLLGRLMDQIGRLQREVLAPHGMTLAGLGHREVDVLRLVADGLSTSEIAGHLSYSERTVKNRNGDEP